MRKRTLDPLLVVILDDKRSGGATGRVIEIWAEDFYDSSPAHVSGRAEGDQG